MAYKDEIAKILSKLPKSSINEGAEKVAKLAQKPQKYVMNKLAESLGVKGDPENSESTAQNLVEAAATKLGVPEDSDIGNAAKAVGVAGLEVFGDPLQVIPVGKIAKMAEKAKQAGVVAKILENFPKANQALESSADFAALQAKASEATKNIKVPKNINIAHANAVVDKLKIKPENIAKKKIKEGASPIPYTHLVRSRS